MTLLHDLNTKDVCTAGCSSTVGGGAVVGVGAISCCTTAASSDISIDESFANNTTVINLIEKIKLDFPRCAEINIDFDKVRYTVSNFSFADRKFVTKEILHGIGGSFRSGELTAIMGPSGSGKSTLLNVMSGFRATGVSGNINVNGKPVSTHAQSFRELSCYIHQNDLLRPQLTVCETMMLAAHLKLGYNVTHEHKYNLVKHILSLLGLEHRLNVFAGKLSGGQKKRLAIALELISNPPVLYLDEPTTGLDSSSTSQCVGLLKKLASQGHTIVCTIHQPSALIFEMFDKLYTVVEGNCMYHGPVRELIPFLNDQGLICPSYHNPADFLLEVAVGEHERDLNKLIDAARKKYYVIQTIEEQKTTTTFEWKKCSTAQFPAYDYVKPDTTIDDKTPHLLQPISFEEKGLEKNAKKHTSSDDLRIQSASFFRQYILLLQRILVCARRNYFLLLARLLSHIVIGVVFGYLYMNVGDKATTVLGNYVYLYGSTLLLVYTGKMAVVLTFPLEIGMLTREHFNRWYNLGPYFLSLLSFEIPFQSFCVVLYMSISVFLTGNDSDANFRIYYFVFLGVMVSLSAQAWGFFVGATLPTKLAVFLGPILAVLFSVFGFCSRYIDITPLFRWMWHISYFRAGFHGSLNAFYGMDRPLLTCPESQMYCHFRSPKVFLNYMMISDVNMSDCVWLMSTVIAVMHLLTLLTLWHKLNKR